VLPNSIKSALVPWLAKTPLRIGYRGEGRVLLLNKRLSHPQGRPPMVAFYGALSGPDFDSAARPRLHLDARTVDAALASASLPRGAFWTLAPGAEYGPAKRWPADHYATLARSLHAADGASIVLLGSKSEAMLCESIAMAVPPGACRVLAGKVPLFDAMALIAASRGLASNDSGLMHVAAALGVPQAAVFGSTSPLHTPPLNARARVLWLKDELGLDCMPCFDRACRFGHTLCLVSVTPERVEAALREAAAAQSENLPA
jgi:heptosyltransferase-2